MFILDHTAVHLGCSPPIPQYCKSKIPKGAETPTYYFFPFFFKLDVDQSHRCTIFLGYIKTVKDF